MLTLNVSKGFRQALKLYAVQHNTTMGEVVQNAVKLFMTANASPKANKRTPEVNQKPHCSTTIKRTTPARANNSSGMIEEVEDVEAGAAPAPFATPDPPGGTSFKIGS